MKKKNELNALFIRAAQSQPTLKPVAEQSQGAPDTRGTMWHPWYPARLSRWDSTGIPLVSRRPGHPETLPWKNGLDNPKFSLLVLLPSISDVFIQHTAATILTSGSGTWSFDFFDGF